MIDSKVHDHPHDDKAILSQSRSQSREFQRIRFRPAPELDTGHDPCWPQYASIVPHLPHDTTQCLAQDRRVLLSCTALDKIRSVFCNQKKNLVFQTVSSSYDFRKPRRRRFPDVFTRFFRLWPVFQPIGFYALCVSWAARPSLLPGPVLFSPTSNTFRNLLLALGPQMRYNLPIRKMNNDLFACFWFTLFLKLR